MGEGLTPLVPFDPARPRVLLKVDYAMPTLSFKDRGAVLVVAHARALGARRIVQDSSGNAGASVAAYAGRAGIPCDIFVPASTSARKIAQIAAYGARVIPVPGSREDTAAAALEAASAGGVHFASHVYDPLFFQGTKTYLYEVFEAMGGRLPDVLFVPLGNGTLFLGIHRGLTDFLGMGLIDRVPKVVAVQAQGCAPIHRAHALDHSTVEAVANQGTEAEGIAIAAPLRGTQILATLRELGADVVLAPESGLAAAKQELARRGFYVETTTAATWAAYRDWSRQRTADDPSGAVQTVVLPLCGAGLKG
jgi:threonine synthase